MEIKWQVPSASYFLNTAGGPAGSLEAIQAAMQTWSDVPASSFTFVYAGTTSSSSHGVNDGQNIVTFAPMGSNGTLAENVFWYNSLPVIFSTATSASIPVTRGAQAAPPVITTFRTSRPTNSATRCRSTIYTTPRIPRRPCMDTRRRGKQKKERSIRTTWRESPIFILMGARSGISTGTGKTDIAVWRPSTGTWWILNSSTGAVTQRQWGDVRRHSVPGDYDGDGKTDIAVWRPSDGQWWILNSSNGSVTQTAMGHFRRRSGARGLRRGREDGYRGMASLDRDLVDHQFLHGCSDAAAMGHFRRRSGARGLRRGREDGYRGVASLGRDTGGSSIPPMVP